MSVPILFGTILTTVLHYRADCEYIGRRTHEVIGLDAVAESIAQTFTHNALM